MTPIEKNVFVVDELGNEYEATYPKRAKGLVKNGRARFISEHTICLACPPNTNLEDKHMTDNIKTPDTEPVIPETNANQEEKRTIVYVLEQIEKISAQTVYLNQAIEQLGKMSDGEAGEACSPGNIAGQAKAQALGDVVRFRETTNQQLISFYTLLYSDLNKQTDSSVVRQFENLTDWMRSVKWEKLPKEARDMIQDSIKEQLSRHW